MSVTNQTILDNLMATMAAMSATGIVGIGASQRTATMVDFATLQALIERYEARVAMDASGAGGNIALVQFGEVQ